MSPPPRFRRAWEGEVITHYRVTLECATCHAKLLGIIPQTEALRDTATETNRLHPYVDDPGAEDLAPVAYQTCPLCQAPRLLIHAIPYVEI